MQVSRIASRVTTTRSIPGSIPLSRQLSIVASRRGGLLRPTHRLGLGPTLGVSTTRSLSLWWWGKSKSSPSDASAQSSDDPNPAVVSEPAPPVDAAVTAGPSTPPIEITQAEPNVISPEVISTTSSTLDTLASAPVVHQLGDFAAHGFGSMWPSGMVQSALELLHVQTGLPWWASIIVLTTVVRAAMLPLNLRLVGNASRLARVQPQLTALTEQIKRAKEAGDSAALQHAGYRAQKLMEEAGANPFKGLLGPLVQMPIALSFFFGIRNICQAGLPSLKHGGLLWFTDLTIPDPTWALPILSSASMLVLLETSAMDAASGAAAHTRNFFRVLAVLTIPIVSYLPSGVLVYFVVNGAFMLIQNALIKLPAVRKAYGILDKPTPPPGATITKPPTFADSLRALKNGLKEAAQKAREQQEAEARLRARANPPKRR